MRFESVRFKVNRFEFKNTDQILVEYKIECEWNQTISKIVFFRKDSANYSLYNVSQ